MAALSNAHRREVHAAVMELFSSTREELPPVTKSQLLNFIGRVDDEQDSAEAALVSGLPAGPAKTWLIANASLGRRIISMVQDKRREAL